ncbi:outer membrane protein, putative [unidentified eubacterium SCB49]|nr:outer membrane protein, putative [unidentified eubacterium SCB49]
MNKFLILLSILFLSQGAFSQTTGITGTINDGEFNDILPFANVIVKDTQTGATSDFEGKYTLELAPGNYTIVYSYVGYQTKEITDVVVVAGALTNTNVTLNASAGQLDEVVITTTARRNTEASVLSLQKNSVNLMDGLSLETIKKTGAGDIASAVKNVPGVSIQGGKFVYVRGLGDRYTKSILNGVDVPGLDPDRNTLQLDIFPTQILENVIVVKAATADQPADFTGGVINIVTKDIPTREEYSLSVGGTYNSNFHFNDNYLASQSSSTDFLGFDNGLRDNPLSSNQVVPLPQQNGAVAEAVTQRFEKRLSAQQETSFMDYSFSATAGNQYEVGDKKLGYLASVSYKNETTYYDEYINGQIYRKDEADKSNFELLADRTQNGQLGNNNVLISALAGLSLKSEKSKYRFNVLHVQNGESQASIFRQSNFIISSNNIIKDNLIYTQRSITNGLLSGKHSLGSEGDWNVDWSLSPTLAKIEDKDFRVTPFRIGSDPVTGEETYTIEPSESGVPSRFFRDLEEINLAGKIDIDKSHTLFGADAKTKFGGGYTFKNRTFDVIKYSIPLLNFPSASINGDPDQILADENIYDPTTNSGFYIRDDSNDSDSYDSDISIASAYVSEEIKVTDRLNSIIGVRFEQFNLSYTGERQDGTSLNGAEILNNSDFFPSLNLIYDLNEDGNQKIRTSFARTTARPSFKEASLAEIFDPISSTTFIGNIDLQPTYINNLDLRYENYGESGDFFAVSGFYKSFKDPIELSFIRRAYGQYTPLNLGDAKVFGGEVEVRKNLGFINGLDKINFNVNVSLIESQQEYSEDEKQGRLDNLRDGETLEDTRQLQGQSPYLVNVGLNYEDKGWNGGLFYNSQGKTLQIVGAGDVADVYTLPFHNLKFNISKSFGEKYSSTISLKFDNLMNDDIESVYQTYGGEDQTYSKWSPGQDISLSYSIKF